MWLLNTTTAELRYFPDASHIERGGFAILSHTWGDNEQTFHDVRRIIKDCQKSSLSPRDHVGEKIRNCCILAERHGYDWVWIDTCCIDKTSSTEVSEAISSMYRWYEQADVCYAYLADVSSGDPLDALESEFRRSRWHTRGWTLQELIAPSSVLFYSKDWTFLGTRAQLSSLLFDITGVWPNILDRTWGVWQASIATRMHWASKRRTARVEDEAYCLLGLFGVDMPIMYGEGRRAFYRLQLEILKNSPDTTLFAWGPYMSQERFNGSGYQRLQLSSPDWKRYEYLLAESPACFLLPTFCYTPHHSTPLNSRNRLLEEAIVNKAPQSNPTVEGNSPDPLGSPEEPQFIMTSQGMKCRLPIVNAHGLTVAILFCSDSRWREYFGLCLTPVASSTSRCFASVEFDNSHRVLNTYDLCRILGLGQDLRNIELWGKRVEPEWRTVYIDPCPPYWQQSPYGINPLGCNLSAARSCDFRIPNWLVTKLTIASFTFGGVLLDRDNRWFVKFNSAPPDRGREVIFIRAGLCSPAATRGSQKPPLWLKLTLGYLNPRIPMTTCWEPHICVADHVEAWGPALEKRFGDEERTVRISFRPDTFDGSSKLVMHIELEGTVYEKMLQDAKVRIPTREELDAWEEARTAHRAPVPTVEHVCHAPHSHLLDAASAEPSELVGARVGCWPASRSNTDTEEPRKRTSSTYDDTGCQDAVGTAEAARRAPRLMQKPTSTHHSMRHKELAHGIRGTEATKGARSACASRGKPMLEAAAKKPMKHTQDKYRRRRLKELALAIRRATAKDALGRSDLRRHRKSSPAEASEA